MITQALTRAQFEAFKTKAAAEGLIITSDSGNVTHSGITANYRYDGKALVVDLVHTPFGMGKIVTNKITEALAEAAK